MPKPVEESGRPSAERASLVRFAHGGSSRSTARLRLPLDAASCAPMHRLLRLFCLAAVLPLVSPSFAGGGSESIAIYAGTEKITSIGGGDTNSGAEGDATGRRRQRVYIAIDRNTGDIQRVRLNSRIRKFFVESAVRYNQVFPRTGGRRSKDHVRLMVVNHATPAEGGYTDSSSHYDGRLSTSVITNAGLSSAYPRLLKWTYAFQFSGFESNDPAVIRFPQIDSGTGLLSLNRVLTQGSVGKNLADAINVITGALLQRRYTEEDL